MIRDTYSGSRDALEIARRGSRGRDDLARHSSGDDQQSEKTRPVGWTYVALLRAALSAVPVLVSVLDDVWLEIQTETCVRCHRRTKKF